MSTIAPATAAAATLYALLVRLTSSAERCTNSRKPLEAPEYFRKGNPEKRPCRKRACNSEQQTFQRIRRHDLQLLAPRLRSTDIIRLLPFNDKFAAIYK